MTHPLTSLELTTLMLCLEEHLEREWQPREAATSFGVPTPSED